jgi:hypothetical protein
MNLNRRSTLTWTWRVTTPAGVIYIPDATVGEAVRRSGQFGIESVQPATAQEAALAVDAGDFDEQTRRLIASREKLVAEGSVLRI